jgi:ATP-dependent helicase/nuclease subunit A
MPKPLKILQASAGSGKTFNLTAHYLVLLFAGDTRYREILAVTFTNKATGEMKTRILDVLAGLAKGDSGVDGIRDIILNAHPILNKESLKTKAEKIYRRILHDYGRFSVSTIDGFVQKVIRGFAFELGLDSGYVLEMNFEKVKNDLAARLNARLDNNPNLLQWIINLAMERIENNKSWNYQNALTDLAGEIFKERYQPFEKAMDKLMADSDIDTLFRNYSSITRSTIKTFETQINVFTIRALELLDGTDQAIFKGKSNSPIAKIVKIPGDFKYAGNLGKVVNDANEWFGKNPDIALYTRLNPVLNELYDFYIEGLPEYTLAKAVDENLYYLRLMQEMGQLLKTYRKESGTLLISDAQNLLLGITGTDDANPSFIWEKMGSRYHYFLFDEFQDTSGSQWTNFKPLLTNAIAEADGEMTEHLIVGDVKQSIYRWRNGDWDILHQRAANEIGETYVIKESLESNYRSAANIIEFNNQLFTVAPLLLQQQLNNKVDELGSAAVQTWWTQRGFDHIMPGVYAQAVQQPHKKTLAGGSVKFNILPADSADDFRTEAMICCIAEIKRLYNEKNYRFGDMGLLVRSNKEAIQAVSALMAEGIPVISGEALMIAGNTAVKLLINTLHVIAGLSENTAIYKAACISLYAQLNGTIFSAADLFGLERKSLGALSGLLPAALCQNWQTWLQAPLPELIEKLIGAYALDQPQNSKHLAYLLAFRDLAGNFAAQGEKGLSSFLQWWDEEGAAKALPAAEHAEAVQVITIHKSKGLAFRAVLLPFCSWDVDGMANSVFWIPSLGTAYNDLESIPVRYKKSLAASSTAHAYFGELLYNYMDALNMLYVAATRAKEHLFMTVREKSSYTNIGSIGDLLVNVIKNIDLPDENVQDSPTKKSQPDNRSVIQLDHYPLTDRLSNVLTAEREYPEADLLSRNAALREGAILHEVLSRAGDTAAIVKQLVLEGYLHQNEAPVYTQKLDGVLSHPGLLALLNQPGEWLSERSIIAASGETYRPDKVRIAPEGITIIDYKFTQQETTAHERQVTGYKNLLNEMGYHQIDAYLFYALSGNLKKI